MHFFKKIKILRKKKFKNPTYLSSPNCLLSSIPYQYNPFSQPKSSYGAKKSKNVKKRHFTPIFAPKVPHIMFFRKNVTRVFALSQKVSGGLAKFQRDLTYSFRELDFFCKKRIKGKCSFEPTGPPSPVSTERQSRMRRPPRGQGCVVYFCFKVFASRGGDYEQRSTHSQKEHPAGALFARKLQVDLNLTYFVQNLTFFLVVLS